VRTFLESHPHDVLVIGAGGAGLRAAIEAADRGASVGLVCKSLLGKAHTVMAEGGVAASLANVAPDDSWETHFRDTMVGGKMLNNWRMALLHAQEAPDRVRELERWGALFDRTRDGRILQRPFGGHTHPRLAHVGDRTGLEMIRTLQDRFVATGHAVYMECTITRLLTDGDRVTGAIGYWRTTGQPVVFPAKAVVLATGGVGRGYRVTSNSWEYSGDGHALAYDAGAELIDMEFVQFHPTGMVWPPGVRGLLVTEGVRGEGGVLKNADGDRFMWQYLPEDRRHEYAADEAEARRWVEALSAGRLTDARQPPELSTRDNVSRAIYTEVKEGRGSPHGGVFLDISYLPAERVKRKLPSMYDQFESLAGVDITKGPMEVGPTTHYVMGGVRVDADTGASTVPGLFAAGEVAGGMHGANRLGGNSLSDLLVFGARAGTGATDFAAGQAKVPDADSDQLEVEVVALAAPFRRPGGANPYALLAELQDVMQTLVGIYRTKEDLETALSRIDDLKRRSARISVEGDRTYNPGWNLVFELHNLLTVCEATTRSALQREESRGAHSRLDHPQTETEWGTRNSVVRRDGEAMSVGTSPLPAMPDEYRELIAARSAKVAA
jgi:succinate dehydrogenase / fumarate reductase flavoprotein subunit